MIPDITNSLILFGGGLSLLIALVQLIQSRGRLKNLLLFMIFASISIIQVQGYVITHAHIEKTGAGMMFLLLAEFIIGPSIYIFYQSVFSRDYVFSKREYVHFVMPVMVIVLIVLLQLHDHLKDGVFIHFYTFIERNSLLGYVYSFGFAVLFGYVMAVFSKMDVVNVIRNYSRNRFLLLSVTVIITLLLITTMIIIALVSGNDIFLNWAMMLTSIFVIFWFIVSQMHPEFFLIQSLKKGNSERIEGLLQGLDIEKLKYDIEKLLVGEKLFYDEDLSLKRLASLLDIQPQELSVFLNHYLKLNFNSFLNRYRVKEAIELMKEDRSRSLLSIAFAVGFNSKSVFYEAFAKETGYTPARYKKNLNSPPESPE